MKAVPVFPGRNPRPTRMGREPAIMGTVSPSTLPRVVGVYAALRSVEAPR